MLGSDDSTKKEIDLRQQKKKKTVRSTEKEERAQIDILRSITGGLHTNGLSTLGIPFAKINSNTFQLYGRTLFLSPIEMAMHITARG